MQTTHRFIFENADNMAAIANESINLVVTSPPYPMIDMWDDLFCNLNPKIGDALEEYNGPQSFERMHQKLDPVWNEVWRILKPGGIACINIGDACRSLNGNFALYPNHSRIIAQMLNIGFSVLPSILWRKQTNAPNKFMGSGMLPPSAYVTLEHEYILIFRKGPKRQFRHDEAKKNRRESALFWEERNTWFSDLWTDVKGTAQNLADNDARNRSAAFPFEIPFRLINMFSVKGDTVADPFAGIGTTVYAAMVAYRNSVSYELDKSLAKPIFSGTERIVSCANARIKKRLSDHTAFIKRRARKSPLKYINNHYHFPVVTQQERELLLCDLTAALKTDENTIKATYSAHPNYLTDILTYIPDHTWQ